MRVQVFLPTLEFYYVVYVILDDCLEGGWWLRNQQNRAIRSWLM